MAELMSKPWIRIAVTLSPLILLTGIAYLSLYAPLYGAIAQKHSDIEQTNRLVDGYRRAIENGSGADGKTALLQSQLRSSFRGIKARSSAAASSAFQTAVRTILQAGGMQIDQMRPSMVETSATAGLVRLTLEGTAPAGEIGSLLHQLESHPAYQIRIDQMRLSVQSPANKDDAPDQLITQVRLQLETGFSTQ